MAAAESEFTFHISKSIDAVDAANWDNILPEDNFLLSRCYLQALEESTGNEVQYRYLEIYHHRKLIGIGFFQLIKFRGSNVENDGAGQKKPLLYQAGIMWRKLVVGIVNQLSLNLLVSGNTFVTGEYGFYFIREQQADFNFLQAVREGIDKIISDSETKISGILIKDFYEQEKEKIAGLQQSGFLEFRVNPNMILDVRPSWKKMDDYLGEMASKYRTRMKKAMKRAETLKIREMTAGELQQLLPVMSLLYDEVVDEAAFKLAKLNIEYIVRLKKESEQKFGVIGFFLGDELVSFISYYLNENDLVAGYMGMRRALNHEYDLYLNVLLKLAETGISHGMKKVIYGRTAMEIKSSVGALPHPMYLYVRHRSSLVNFIIKRVVSYLSSEEKWTLRNPFRN